MPPVRSTADDKNGRPRQDPVSCQLCRLKKLKCDRQRPCSNCQTRNLACEYKGERQRTPHVAVDTANGSSADLLAENQAIKARLKRLENAVFGEQGLVGSFPADDIRDRSTAAASTPAKARTEDIKADEDSNWLESIGTRSEVVIPQFSFPLTVNVCSLDHFLYADQRPTPATRAVDIPTYDVAIHSLDAYAEHLDGLQHIMHIESTRHMIDKVYAQIHAQQMVDPGALSFILALCANIGFFWTVGFHQGTALFQDQEMALKISTEWTKHALVAMEQARIAVPSTSLETIQASVMLMFLLYHMEGFTFRVRMMHAGSVAMARDLGLHKTDFSGRSQVTTQAEVIDLEVRRKLWWHMACTDWFLAFIGGPHEGMYSIHPRHMNVELPRNITRNDLNTKGFDFQRDVSEPTVMSYYLQRLRLAGTCRDISDALYKFSEPTEADYDVVKMLDAKFETQIQDLPRFLRFDLPTDQLRAEYGEAYSHQTSMQAIMTNLMISTRRCKLHLPYLIRAKTNPQYLWSRRIGLQAARCVFNVRRIVMEDETSTSAAHLKLGGIRQHIFYATTILVMDLCVNRNEEDQGQLAEVREALQIIQDTKAPGESQMGDRFYDSLMAVLRKHHVKLPVQTTTPAPQAYHQLQHGHSAPPSGTNGYGQDMMSNPFAKQDNSGLAFDPNIWADFLEQAPSIEAQDWDALLTDLDMRLI